MFKLIIIILLLFHNNYLFAAESATKTQARSTILELPTPELPKQFKWRERAPNNKACPDADEDFYQKIYIQDDGMKKNEYVKLPGKLYVSETGPYKVPKNQEITYPFSKAMEKIGYQQLRVPTPQLNLLISGVSADGHDGGVLGYVAFKNGKVRMATFAYKLYGACDDDDADCQSDAKKIDPSFCLELFISDLVEFKDVLPKTFLTVSSPTK